MTVPFHDLIWSQSSKGGWGVSEFKRKGCVSEFQNAVCVSTFKKRRVCVSKLKKGVCVCVCVCFRVQKRGVCVSEFKMGRGGVSQSRKVGKSNSLKVFTKKYPTIDLVVEVSPEISNSDFEV